MWKICKNFHLLILINFLNNPALKNDKIVFQQQGNFFCLYKGNEQIFILWYNEDRKF